jgi:hypothetical protein
MSHSYMQPSAHKTIWQNAGGGGEDGGSYTSKYAKWHSTSFPLLHRVSVSEEGM